MGHAVTRGSDGYEIGDRQAGRPDIAASSIELILQEGSPCETRASIWWWKAGGQINLVRASPGVL
jgi:hypothetical protein